jgi:hypothetical protein
VDQERLCLFLALVKKVIAKGTWVGHFVDGKIVEDWYTYDLMSWLQQAGIIPVAEEQK